jgi:ABC-type protease/lipase transport system fused ATPase/permease subunit
LDLPTPTGQLSVEQAVIAPSRQAPPVLAGINLSLERGDVLAVIGPSGSGKSCLCRGLVGVWPLLGGAIRLDGAELSQYGRKALACHVGYLPQAVEILDGSVAENIARMGEVNDAEVIRACQLSGVHDLVVRLPEGYGTKIGLHGGLPLSPGQRQRLGLARAIYGEAKIVVLDEPNSNLDEEGEKALERCVHTLRDNGVTVVIVTHRPAILKISTKVLLLNNGKQIAFGPTAEVLGNLARKVAAFPQAANARGAAPGVSDEGRV